jgi:hypothetical protein
MKNKIYYLTVYYFKGDIPKEFPFIHANPRNDCLVVTWTSEEPFTEEEKEDLPRKQFEEHQKTWYKTYIVY